MFRSVGKAFEEAFYNLRTNFFQTILSVLGIIIGVGALVTMLSLIDGLEATARERIADRSTLENILVQTNTHQSLDGIRLRKDTIAQLKVADLEALLHDLPNQATGQLMAVGSKIIPHPTRDTVLGVRTVATSLPLLDTTEIQLLHGRKLIQEDQEKRTPVTMINEALARRLIGPQDSLDTALGLKVVIGKAELEVIGVTRMDEESGLVAGYPLVIAEALADPPTPQMLLALESVEEVLDAKAFTETWLAERYAGIEEPFQVATQESWLNELKKGFLLFRIVMGLIVGIAVVVGGVGVMNVLLMSISARTAEIGIRKAVGANRRTIISQFLSESVAISIIGSFFGLLLGVLVALGVAPLLSMFVPDLEFQAVFSLRTILTVGTIAVLVGIIFGTYPARRAAKLDPVDAIRRA